MEGGSSRRSRPCRSELEELVRLLALDDEDGTVRTERAATPAGTFKWSASAASARCLKGDNVRFAGEKRRSGLRPSEFFALLRASREVARLDVAADLLCSSVFDNTPTNKEPPRPRPEFLFEIRAMRPGMRLSSFERGGWVLLALEAVGALCRSDVETVRADSRRRCDPGEKPPPELVDCTFFETRPTTALAAAALPTSCLVVRRPTDAEWSVAEWSEDSKFW